MFLPVLQRSVIVVLTLVSALFSRAQQSHFVYLQTETGQPFYVKINNKVVSSSSGGYLILPKLEDGDYRLSIGFPKKEFPEENFQLAIDKNNEGFLLKNFGEKGWGLFNLQSYTVVMGGNDAMVSAPKSLQDDQFSRMLADVVKDSSILQKKEPLQEVASKIDSGIVAGDSNAVAAVLSGPLLSPATRFLTKKNRDGLELIYIDHNLYLNDTIRIFIPARKGVIKAANADNIAQNTNPPAPSYTDTASVAADQAGSRMKSDTDLVVSPPKENVVQNKDSVMAQKTDEVKTSQIHSEDSVIRSPEKGKIIEGNNIVVLPKVVQSSTSNSDCKAFAGNEDFLKLRKKMASGNSEDNMIKIAKKAFHSKCFSTEQIKNLSFLFLTDAGKYMFFDLAYPFASDSEQYKSLQSQLTDSYYINRFKAMIHK